MKATYRYHVVAAAAASVLTLTALSGSAWGKSQKDGSHGSMSAMAGQPSDGARAMKASQPDTKPGPAWKTIGGVVKDVRGDMYVMEDYEGNQVKVHVGQGTKHLRGSKKVGDNIRAEITRGGFANSIQ